MGGGRVQLTSLARADPELDGKYPGVAVHLAVVTKREIILDAREHYALAFASARFDYVHQSRRGGGGRGAQEGCR